LHERPDSSLFFKRLGARLRQFREDRGWSSEDMLTRGIGAKHWQQMETGRPVTGETLLRICQAFDITLSVLVSDLDAGIYKKLPTPLPRKQRKSSRIKRPKSDEAQ
jgi:transcriptional regulator with XRE-family HTH domain